MEVPFVLSPHRIQLLVLIFKKVDLIFVLQGSNVSMRHSGQAKETYISSVPKSQVEGFCDAVQKHIVRNCYGLVINFFQGAETGETLEDQAAF